MIVGTLRLRFFLSAAQSLKDKRQVVRSIADRTRSKFSVSVAEVDDLEQWQSAVLGVACVSNDARHANEILSRVVSFVERLQVEAELIDYQLEVVHIN